MSEWHKQNKDKLRAWQAKNRDKLRAAGKRYSQSEKGKRHRREYERKNREKINAQQRAWRARNKQKVRDYTIKCRRKNPQIYRKRVADWRRRNADYLYHYYQARRLADPEKHRKWMREWKAKTPWANSLRQQRRLARKRGVPTDDKAVTEFIKAVKANGSGVCAYCATEVSGFYLTVDHIVPLSRGGHHMPYNLCIACRACNTSKKDQLISEWKHRPTPQT